MNSVSLSISDRNNLPTTPSLYISSYFCPFWFTYLEAVLDGYRLEVVYVPDGVIYSF